MIGTDHLDSDDPERKDLAQASKWLMIIYEQHRQLAHDDIGRAWTVLQIFIPVSLAPFAVFAATEDLSRVVTAALGAASALLLLTANLFSDRLEQHERRTWLLVRAIEAEIGLAEIGDGWRLGPMPLRGVRTRTIRWALLVLVLLIWIILVCAS